MADSTLQSRTFDVHRRISPKASYMKQFINSTQYADMRAQVNSRDYEHRQKIKSPKNLLIPEETIPFQKIMRKVKDSKHLLSALQPSSEDDNFVILHKHDSNQVKMLQKIETAEFQPPTYQELSQAKDFTCLLYTSPSPRDKRQSRMPSSA